MGNIVGREAPIVLPKVTISLPESQQIDNLNADDASKESMKRELALIRDVFGRSNAYSSEDFGHEEDSRFIAYFVALFSHKVDAINAKKGQMLAWDSHNRVRMNIARIKASAANMDAFLAACGEMMMSDTIESVSSVPEADVKTLAAKMKNWKYEEGHLIYTGDHTGGCQTLRGMRCRVTIRASSIEQKPVRYTWHPLSNFYSGGKLTETSFNDAKDTVSQSLEPFRLPYGKNTLLCTSCRAFFPSSNITLSVVELKYAEDQRRYILTLKVDDEVQSADLPREMKVAGMHNIYLVGKLAQEGYYGCKIRGERPVDDSFKVFFDDKACPHCNNNVNVFGGKHLNILDMGVQRKFPLSDVRIARTRLTTVSKKRKASLSFTLKLRPCMICSDETPKTVPGCDHALCQKCAYNSGESMDAKRCVQCPVNGCRTKMGQRQYIDLMTPTCSVSAKKHASGEQSSSNDLLFAAMMRFMDYEVDVRTDAANSVSSQSLWCEKTKDRERLSALSQLVGGKSAPFIFTCKRGHIHSLDRDFQSCLSIKCTKCAQHLRKTADNGMVSWLQIVDGVQLADEAYAECPQSIKDKFQSKQEFDLAVFKCFMRTLICGITIVTDTPWTVKADMPLMNHPDSDDIICGALLSEGKTVGNDFPMMLMNIYMRMEKQVFRRHLESFGISEEGSYMKHIMMFFREKIEIVTHPAPEGWYQSKARKVALKDKPQNQCLWCGHEYANCDSHGHELGSTSYSDHLHSQRSCLIGNMLSFLRGIGIDRSKIRVCVKESTGRLSRLNDRRRCKIPVFEEYSREVEVSVTWDKMGGIDACEIPESERDGWKHPYLIVIENGDRELSQERWSEVKLSHVRGKLNSKYGIPTLANGALFPDEYDFVCSAVDIMRNDLLFIDGEKRYVACMDAKDGCPFRVTYQRQGKTFLLRGKGLVNVMDKVEKMGNPLGLKLFRSREIMAERTRWMKIATKLSAISSYSEQQELAMTLMKDGILNYRSVECEHLFRNVAVAMRGRYRIPLQHSMFASKVVAYNERLGRTMVTLRMMARMGLNLIKEESGSSSSSSSASEEESCSSAAAGSRASPITIE